MAIALSIPFYCFTYCRHLLTRNMISKFSREFCSLLTRNPLFVVMKRIVWYAINGSLLVGQLASYY